jgi:hypothetical protein
MVFHDIEGEAQIGDTAHNISLRRANRLRTFERVSKVLGLLGSKADWGWVRCFVHHGTGKVA